MHHLILGYGYCGYYLAQELLKHQQQVTTISRHCSEEMKLPGLNHVLHDLNEPFNWTEPDTIIYYLIPPSSQGEGDSFLKQFLSRNKIQAQKVIYFGSSGVYGNYQGAWVNEESSCLIQHPRQLRRLDAEHQWLAYCGKHLIRPIILRIAGIYGPGRLPMEAAQNNAPLIEKETAPFVNHIYVRDLAAIACKLSQIQSTHSLYNVADGNPQPMGALQQYLAQELGISPPAYESWQSAWEKASPMKREFMQGSKRLSIARLQTTLGTSLLLTPLQKAMQQSM